MKRVLTAALLFGFLAGIGIALARPASADSITYARVAPAEGTTGQAIELHLPDGAYCPQEATRIIVRLNGPGLDSPLNVTGNTDIRALDTKSIPGTAILPLLWTLRDAGAFVQPKPVELDGDYRITMSCLAGLSLASLGDTIADITIDSDAGTYRVTSPNPAPVAPPEGATEPASDVAAQGDGGSASQRGTADDPAAGSQSAQDVGEPSGLDPQSSSNGMVGDTADADVSGANGAEASDGAMTGQEASAPVVALEAAPDPSSSVIKPLLIGGGIFLLVVVLLLGVRSRRNAQ